MADMSNKRFKIRCRVLSWCGLRPWKHLRNLQSRFSLSIHSVIMRLTRHGLSALGNGLVNSQNFAKGCMAFMHYNYVTDGFFFFSPFPVLCRPGGLPPDPTLRERRLQRPDGGAHRGLPLSAGPLPSHRDPLAQRAGGLLGPLRAAQLQGQAVPAEARGLQGLPRLGVPECQGGLFEESHGFLLK